MPFAFPEEAPLTPEQALLRNVRVFISSTSVDLVEYRQAVFSAIQTLGGTGEDMVHWTADERRPVDVSLSRVRASNVLVLVVAHRYGFVPENETHSITELEFRAAQEATIPVLAFFLDPEVLWPPKYVERERQAELEQFKALVTKSYVIEYFRSSDDLRARVATGLALFAARHRRQIEKDKRFAVRTERVNSVAELLLQPDATIDIRRSYDGLPLLLSIRRSIDVQALLENLSSNLETAGMMLPPPAIKSFRQIIDDHSRTSWAAKGIVHVGMREGSTTQMYVTSRNLSELFEPLLSTILRVSSHRNVSQRRQGARRGTPSEL